MVTNAATTSQSTIDEAVTTMNNAVIAFNAKKVVTHDTTVLESAIQAAKALYDGAVEGTADGQYEVGSKDTLQAAITVAQSVVTNGATTSQTAIDEMVTTINNAVTEFNSKKVVTHDTTALQSAIQAAQTLHDGATEGTVDGQYAIGSKAILQAAITAAQLVVTNGATTTQTAIDEAVTTINNAVTTFKEGKVVTHDTTALQSVIQAAKALYDKAVEGTEYGQYAQGSKKTLQDAIDAAQLIVTNAGTTSQTTIDEAVNTLNNAVSTFNAGEVTSFTSKDITNFDFSTTYATQAREESQPIVSTNFKNSPKTFSISDGTYTIPVNLNWDIPLNGFTIGQVVGSAVDSIIQQYFVDRGIDLGNRTIAAIGTGNTFSITTFKTGSNAAITLTGNNWTDFFQTSHFIGTDEDHSKNRSFTVSDGVKTTTVVLEWQYNDMDDMVSDINDQLSIASVSALVEKVDNNHFKIRPVSNATITIGGDNKGDLF